MDLETEKGVILQTHYSNLNICNFNYITLMNSADD